MDVAAIGRSYAVRWRARALFAAGLVSLTVATSALAGSTESGSAAFDAALKEVEAAQLELVRGNPGPFKALWSTRDDVTLVGALGGAIEKGSGSISKRLDWVSSQYSEGQRKHQEVSRVVGQDVAHIVQHETIRFRVPGSGAETTQELRATMVFRLESGAWRLVHRHADAQITKAPLR